MDCEHENTITTGETYYSPADSKTGVQYECFDCGQFFWVFV